MPETDEDNNNCDPRDHENVIPMGRFAIAPTSATSELRSRKVSVTLVEGKRKTSIYNWVSMKTANQLISVSKEDGFAI